MNIRKATIDDLPQIMELIAYGKQKMRQIGNDKQWVNGYPDRDVMTNDILSSFAHLLCQDDGTPVATFTLISGIEPAYAHIDGDGWIDDTTPYHTIHRVASAPGVHGVFAAIVGYCDSLGIKNLRIDTHRDNSAMRHCIINTGFSFCGIVQYPAGERLAYQRVKP